MVKKAVSTSTSSTTNKVKKVAKNTTTTKSLSSKSSTAKKTTKTSKKTVSKKTAGKKTSKSSTTSKSTTSTTEPTTTEPTTSTEPTTTVELSAIDDDTTTTEVPEKSQHLEAALKRTEEMYDELIESFDALVKQNKALLARAKRNKKQSLKELNSVYNKAIKEKKPRKNRKPSGFAKATPISDELCNFLSVFRIL